MLAELEVVMSPHTPLQVVHDVSLDLQSKVEKVRVFPRVSDCWGPPRLPQSSSLVASPGDSGALRNAVHARRCG